MSTPETLLDGLAFPECPRVRAGRLWFSDVYAGEVLCLDPATGSAEVVARVEGHPAGLGFLPDGRLLIAAGVPRTVLRLESDGRLVEHADLSHVATWHLNDMFVDTQGRAYVGNYGDASAPPDPARPAALALVEPDGSVRVAAEDLEFANGIVATGDGRTLIVAETRSRPGRLTAFTVADDGSLTDRRVLIEFDSTVFPDGIAIDSQDGVWVASPFDGRVLRVSMQGEITDEVKVAHPYAVAVDGDSLLVCSSSDWRPEVAVRDRTGAIVRVRIGDGG
ncbi:SMP-30/gluconolactonase/LRE family protein [Rhodococcus sp. CH91]|uniref:SMP-30/gluconolactonase/LRE family protein n=1 Tax=Rhodococcus sp. CH91 TaxID=2910256 RepID=UPI001F4AC4BB|nr:SMP-30/gluconolactonase/LRE family protein [Rhodococcus sp. CH91]